MIVARRAGAAGGQRWLVTVAALATASVVAWRLEVELVKGWQGLAWLAGYPWTALPICVFVSFSALAPLSASRTLALERRVMFIVIVAAASWLSFELARTWF
jgi:hypothetical protein